MPKGNTYWKQDHLTSSVRRWISKVKNVYKPRSLQVLPRRPPQQSECWQVCARPGVKSGCWIWLRVQPPAGKSRRISWSVSCQENETLNPSHGRGCSKLSICTHKNPKMYIFTVWTQKNTKHKKRHHLLCLCSRLVGDNRGQVVFVNLTIFNLSVLL